MAVQLSFTPVGIALQGDFTPGPGYGAICREGKSLDWFTSRLGSDYMAGKFFQRVWCPEQTRDNWEWRLEDAVKELAEQTAEEGVVTQYMCALPDRLRKLLANDENFSAPEALRSALEEHEIRYDSEEFSYHIPEQAEADLWAIQHRFAELWRAHVAAERQLLNALAEQLPILKAELKAALEAQKHG
jgi:hypothetical protein